ncbi:hypothetical protein ACFZAI_20305 [Achromobacter sp. NPDC008082]|uniref:hypothetical protein n=1 Tax=Achromobacter sp. NPDC008082 TaxID=3363888 RepID=UPI0036E428AA
MSRYSQAKSRRERRAIVRHVCLPMLMSGLAGIAMPTFAGPADLAAQALTADTEKARLSRLRFPPGSSHVLLADQLWLYGYPAQVLVFDTPATAPNLIRMLSAQQPALVDLNVLPGQLILSGRFGDEQWVAQMQSTRDGRTVGSVSTMRLVPASNPMSLPTPAWLPEGARLHLDFAVMEAGVRVSERIWRHALPPARLTPLVQAGLRREGWRQLSEDGPDQSWTRRNDRMQISVTPLETGSGLRVTGWAS